MCVNIEHLNNLSMKQHIVVKQLAAGMATTRSTKMKFILNSLRIKHATVLLTTGAITIKEFLIQCSHCVDGYLTRELNWQDESEDSEEEADINVINVINAPVVEVVEDLLLNNNVVDNSEINDPEQEVPADVENQAVNNILNPEEEYNEADFFVPEDLALAIWEEQYGNDKEQEIPYAPVPQNIVTMFPRRNEEGLCVVCRDGVRTHARIPCGHRVLCI
ncbi:uncharacterized protein LOC111029239, partial [Myzus persicae]|uniref:uncharacterized protein LOC111029239 n=1 Tax=Myzus persicae TaxID=13164 RepID=UPI000B939467